MLEDLAPFWECLVAIISPTRKIIATYKVNKSVLKEFFLSFLFDLCEEKGFWNLERHFCHEAPQIVWTNIYYGILVLIWQNQNRAKNA